MSIYKVSYCVNAILWCERTVNADNEEDAMDNVKHTDNMGDIIDWEINDFTITEVEEIDDND